MHARKPRHEWQAIIRAFERSGQTHEAFCATRGLNVGSFRGWLYGFRRESPGAVELVPVDVVRHSATIDGAGRGGPIVIFAGDVELRVTSGTDPTYVARLVGELRRC